MSMPSPKSILCIFVLSFGLTRNEPEALHGRSSGTPRDWAVERVRASRETYEPWAREYEAGRANAFGVYLWSERWARAEAYHAKGKAGRVASAEAHSTRM